MKEIIWNHWDGLLGICDLMWLRAANTPRTNPFSNCWRSNDRSAAAETDSTVSSGHMKLVLSAPEVDACLALVELRRSINAADVAGDSSDGLREDEVIEGDGRAATEDKGVGGRPLALPNLNKSNSKINSKCPDKFFFKGKWIKNNALPWSTDDGHILVQFLQIVAK